MEEYDHNDLLQTNLNALSDAECRKLLTLYMTQQKLGLYWERNQIEHDQALNSDAVFLRLADEHGEALSVGDAPYQNLIIEGDNFDALRCLRATHANKIRVIYIDPPYNTGNKDWVYNDRYVNKDDRYKASMWLEFLYRRLLLARDLLTSDGVILVSINDENRAKLELLMDKIFVGMRIGSFIWKKRRSSNAAGVEHFYSCDHEHVLAYGGALFEFSGSAKNWDKYDQWDEQAQDWWTSTQLTLGFNRIQRPNLYYPLHNPSTDIWYPCDANRVWARASEAILKGKEVRTESMEELIRRNGVSFPEEKQPAFYTSIQEIELAIEAGNAPRHLDTQRDLSFWVGKLIGYGKPRFKTYKSKVRSDSQPLSSLITEAGKSEDYDASLLSYSISTGLTSEGTRALREFSIAESFPYPKPLSLIKNLLQQTTQPNDIVLDFFAGSGTTAQAVLQLNQEDDGNRRFILVSSTEAPPNDPDNKNLCRDVCRVRVQRVIEGHNAITATGGNFAYCRIAKIPPADVLQDLDAALIWHRLCLLYRRELLAYPAQSLNTVYQDAETAVVFCPHLDEPAISELKALAGKRLALYSDRPDTAAELLSPFVSVQSLSAIDAVLSEQG
ncbi:site-specific DNA-methyltransferase [Methylomonas sp. CM2]|uniref:site-specific DNA-methyltransferase n=1 Tax=Methylomonas sp. CM2 TaxID=3417647 RepID=UPI003CF414EA